MTTDEMTDDEPDDEPATGGALWVTELPDGSRAIGTAAGERQAREAIAELRRG